jgi:hypothetical protein
VLLDSFPNAGPDLGHLPQLISPLRGAGNDEIFTFESAAATGGRF